jgi:integrase
LDMDVGLWRLPAGRAKNKRAHRIPLTDLALRLLRELPQADSGPLFRTSTGAPLPPARVSTWVSQQSWPIEHWTAHDLRRSAATGMRANGCAVADIAALLNHTEIGITAKIYARSDRWPEKVRAVDSLDQWLKLCRVA